MSLPKRWKRAVRWASASLVVLTVTAATAYWWTRPQVVFLGFPDMYRFVLAQAASDAGVRYDYWRAEQVDDADLKAADFRRYKVIYVSARRSDPLSRPMKDALAEAQSAGSRVIVIPPQHTARLGIGTTDFHEKEKWLGDYWQYGGVKNMVRFLHATEALYLGAGNSIEPPLPTPDDGYYHPDAPEPLTTTKDYLDWYKSSGHWREGSPRIFIDFADGWKLGMNAGTDALIRAFEKREANVGAVFGVGNVGPFAVEFQPDLILSRKHGRWWLGEPGVEVLRSKLDVPLLRGLSLLFTGETFSQYQQTRAGIRGAGLAMGAIIPELDGAIEPTLIEGLEAEWYGRRYEAVSAERIERLVERAFRWIRLRRTPNQEKRIAVMYVSGIGKGRITAASLNVPRSLIRFLDAMKGDGYSLAGAPADEDRLLEEMLAKGRNISEEETGELNALAGMDDVTLLPAEPYVAWFRTLPEAMQAEVESAFGPPPGRFMTIERDGYSYFLIPKLDFGNVLVMPQPARGAHMDAKLQHNDRVPPPHQYLAVYWWLREVWKADAVVSYGTHGTLEFLPGRPLGQLADDWPDRVLGMLPNIYVYVMDNVGEALIAKRRGSAVTVSYQIPPIAAASLSEADRTVGTLYRACEQFLAQDDGVLKERLREQVRKQGHELEFDHDLGLDWSAAAPADEEIRDLHLHIHLINDDKVPLGLHVHGEADSPADLAPLVTAMLGPAFVERIGGSLGAGWKADRAREQARERAEAIVQEALEGRPADQNLRPDHARVLELKEIFAQTENEIPRTLHALGGGYIPPGGGGDPIRNPGALPTGRNLYGINPAEVPTRAAWDVGEQLAQELVEKERRRLGRMPRKVGFTLWNTEIIRQHGTDVAQILALLGVRPVWDHLGVVADVELIPAAELGRPRIDVVIQASSLFRDTFPDRMELLDKAVRLAVSAEDGENYLAENTGQMELDLKRGGMSARDARVYAAARVFSNAPGGYSTGLVDRIEKSGGYSDTAGLTEEYLGRTGKVYVAHTVWGANVPGLYRRALAGADAVCLSRSTNAVSALTLDHYFEYLGGMTMAVRDISGLSPETYIADVRDPVSPGMQTLEETLTRDLRGQFWNPRWIAAQQEEGFSGAAGIAKTTANLFGWQVTKPEAVGEYVWDEVYRVYVEDSLGLGLPQWFDHENPYAYQNLTSVLLESARKGFWRPSAQTLREVANRYAESVSLHGPAGDIRTVDNAVFHEFLQEQLNAPGNGRGRQLTLRYDKRLEASLGRPPSFVVGQKLVPEDHSGSEPAVMEYSAGSVLALLALGVAFFVGARRKRGRD